MQQCERTQRGRARSRVRGIHSESRGIHLCLLGLRSQCSPSRWLSAQYEVKMVSVEPWVLGYFFFPSMCAQTPSPILGGSVIRAVLGARGHKTGYFTSHWLTAPGSGRSNCWLSLSLPQCPCLNLSSASALLEPGFLWEMRWDFSVKFR